MIRVTWIFIVYCIDLSAKIGMSLNDCELVGAVGSASVSKSEGREFEPPTGHRVVETK